MEAGSCGGLRKVPLETLERGVAMTRSGPGMRLGGWTLAAVAAALVCLAGAAALAGAGAEEADVFRFDPPDGTTFTETSKTVQVADMESGQTPPRETVYTGGVVIRKAESGHTVAATLISVETRVGAKQASDVALDALKGMALTYRIDAEGRMTDVEGVEDVRRRFGEAFPPDVVASVSKMLDKPVLLASEQADWRRRVGNLIGRPTRDGCAWLTTEEFSLPSGGMLTYYVAARVDRHIRTAGRDCVRVLYEYAMDPKDLSEFLGEAAEAVTGEQEAFTSESRMSGRGYRIVDPTTLLCYGERLSRTVDMMMPVPGRGEMAVTLQQTKSYEYRYED